MDWKYPFHLDMKLNVLRTKVTQSKYDHIYGPYEYDPTHMKGPTYSLTNRVLKQESKTKIPTEKRMIPRVERLYESKQANHGGCKDCDHNIAYKTETFEALNCKILIPNRRRFALVRKRLQISEPDSYPQTQTTSLQNQQEMKDSDLDLRSWIFTPTHGRSLSGNLNLTHNMVDNKPGNFKSFIHVLVVQKNQFEAYAKRWSSSHVIIELPEYLPEYMSDVTAKIGKVGYARRFIQLIAEKFELDTIFMLDDNIPCLYDIEVDENSHLKLEGKEVKRKNVPLYNVLIHIESQFDGSKNPPKPHFQPHQDATYKSKLEGYTGPSKKYGVIGVLRNSKYSSSVCHPFGNTHVCGLTFLNIKALKEHEIQFQAWPAWEDLTLNNDCDQAGLFVVKYNRFVCFKRNIPSWLPEVFIWDDQTILSTTENTNAKPTERSVDLLLKYIQSSAAPKYCRVWPEKATENCQDMKSLRVAIQQSKAYKHHIVFFYPTHSLTTVQDYFTHTPGLHWFDRHIMVFPIAACRQLQIYTVAAIQSEIVHKNFSGGTDEEDESQSPASLYSEMDDMEDNTNANSSARESSPSSPKFEVVTSHNINDFKVPMLLVYVEGKGR